MDSKSGVTVYTNESLYPPNCLFICQHELRNSTQDNNAVVLALILYSDSTTVSQNMRDTVWPIYLTLGNIPLARRKDPGCFQLLGFIPSFPGVEYGGYGWVFGYSEGF